MMDINDKSYIFPYIAADFKCAKCGKRLGVKPAKSTELTGFTNDYQNSFGEGKSSYAATFTLEVSPCKTCIEKVTEPARILANAVKALQG